MDEEKKDRPKTVNIFLGFFFMLNLVVGTGFLGVPYAFVSAGLLAGAATLVVIAFVSWNCAIWELEFMARAQALLEYNLQGGEGKELKPKFHITLTRKFEPSELCEIFVGRWFKFVYLISLTCTIFLACVSYSTVAGSAWAVNIPLKFSGIEQCQNDAFKDHTLPVDPSCRNAYWFCLFLFACIVVPLSLIELKEQAIVQLAMGLLRFTTIGAIVIFCIVNLAMYKNICSCDEPWGNATDPAICDVNTTMGNTMTHFDGKAWVLAIPVFVYAHILHQAIPTLTHPLKEKNWLRCYFNTLYLVIIFIYMILGVTVSLWFKTCTNETCTLNWDHYIKFDNTALKVLSYYIIFFPSLDVVSVFPLVVLTLVNNVYSVFFCRDTTEAPNTWTTFFVRLLMKLVASLLPIFVAMAVSNLFTVLNYAGLTGFFICFFAPTIIQLRSQWVCKKTFANAKDEEDLMNNPTGSDTNIINTKIEESLPLIPKNNSQFLPFKLLSNRHRYMTPYSTIFSYWPAVVIIGGVGVVLFLLTIVSLFAPLFGSTVANATNATVF